MRVAVVTIAAGRHAHLARQAAALADSSVVPAAHVVVAMDDPEIPTVVPHADVVHVPRVDGRLPLAAARNAGVHRARDVGADLLVLLDVDCLPAPELLARYAGVAATHDGVLCGPVGYLPPAPPGGYPGDGLHALAVPHPARPVPAPDEVLPNPDPDLFWSLSFAATPATWARVGGFCEDYTGYGGEDTDFGWSARAAGVRLWWIGGAWAYHQHHGPGGPPAQHLHDVVRNAGVFFDRHGRWPMRGWLDDFAERGLAHVDPVTRRWVVS
jgi:GT2 family glycosyltransferase